MSRTVVFTCEGNDHEIELVDRPDSETLRQLAEWLPAEITIHCAKIAGCHIYWPSPILARLEEGTNIHELPPGSFLYYPDRQYLEIIYDELQAETAAVTYLGKLSGEIDWLREFATRQRQEAGSQIFTATLRFKDAPEKKLSQEIGGETAWVRVRRARQAVWTAEPPEIGRMLANSGHNIPFGPMATADGYFRFVQESLWQIWVDSSRFSEAACRAIAINSMELGIARLGHYCHLSETEAFLTDAIRCVEEGQSLGQILPEVILYCSRMSNWVDLHIPWYPSNELTKRLMGRTD